MTIDGLVGMACEVPGMGAFELPIIDPLIKAAGSVISSPNLIPLIAITGNKTAKQYYDQLQAQENAKLGVEQSKVQAGQNQALAEAESSRTVGLATWVAIGVGGLGLAWALSKGFASKAGKKGKRR